MLKNIIEVLKFTFTNTICLVALVIMYFVLAYDWLTSLVLTIVLGAIVYYQTKGKRKPEKTVLGRVSPEKEVFYREQGLTKNEMNMFRNTMHAARNHIYEIETNVKSRTKLTAITQRNNTLPIMKDFFKHIVEQPQRLHEASDFLYTQLPNLKELTDNYVEVDNHVSKTKDTYQSLESSANVIDALCQKIQKSYTDFMEKDVDKIEVEMALAKHTMAGDNGSDATVTEPSDTEL